MLAEKLSIKIYVIALLLSVAFVLLEGVAEKDEHKGKFIFISSLCCLFVQNFPITTDK